MKIKGVLMATVFSLSISLFSSVSYAAGYFCHGTCADGVLAIGGGCTWAEAYSNMNSCEGHGGMVSPITCTDVQQPAIPVPACPEV